MDRAGLPQDAQRPGKSLVPALRGENLPEDRQIYAESLYGRLHFGWKELFSLTTSRYSFVLAPRQELYDIRQDPGQLRNLLPQGSSVASGGPELPGPDSAEYETLHRKLKSYVAQTPLKAPNPVDEEELEKLRALGSIGSPTLDPASDDSAPDPKDRIGDLALYRQAVRIKKIHRYARVAEILQEVVKTSPRMINAWDELSEAEQRLGDLGKAADALKKSLRIAPRRTRPLFELVDILVQLRRFDEAREVLRMAPSQKPGEVETRRAFLELVEGKPEAAREAAGRASQDFPAALPLQRGCAVVWKPGVFGSSPAVSEGSRRTRGTFPTRLALHPLPPRRLPGPGMREGRRRIRADRPAPGSGTAPAEGAFPQHNEFGCRHVAVSSPCPGGRLRKVHDVLNVLARGNPSIATYELVAHLYGAMNLDGDAARWAERARSLRGK